MGAPVKDPEIGSVFGRVTTLSLSESYGKGLRYKRIRIKCECGTEKWADKTALLKGATTSCGCYAKERIGNQARSHGMSKTPIYAIWNMMRQRCQTPTYKLFHDYGGRGIKVCDEWQTFEGFYADMGDPPFPGASLERKDTNGNYDKDNCIWANRLEQNNNTRKTVLYDYQGERLTLKQIAEKVGMNPNSLSSRIYGQGLSMEEAVSRPIMSSHESGALAGTRDGTYRGRSDGAKKYT